MDTLITVVIPTYQRPVLLSRCLDSLCRQTFPDNTFEVIVVSDGPDPKTEAIISSVKKTRRIKLRFQQLAKKKGPAAARNAGWRSAKGALIVFTDDDCIADSQWLTRIWAAYAAHRGKVIAFTGRVVVPIPERPTDHERNIRQLETAEFITANCACSRKALEITDGFDETFTLAWREDSDLHFKLLRYNIPVVHVGDAVIVHPVRKARWGISIKEQKKSMFNALLYKKYPDLYRTRIQRSAPWHYYLIVMSFAGFLLSAILMLKGAMFVILTVWLLLTAAFVARRLKGTSHSLTHVSEMTVTSLVIPFLSLFWRFYGSWKYKTFLI